MHYRGTLHQDGSEFDNSYDILNWSSSPPSPERTAEQIFFLRTVQKGSDLIPLNPSKSSDSRPERAEREEGGRRLAGLLPLALLLLPTFNGVWTGCQEGGEGGGGGQGAAD